MYVYTYSELTSECWKYPNKFQYKIHFKLFVRKYNTTDTLSLLTYVHKYVLFQFSYLYNKDLNDILYSKTVQLMSIIHLYVCKYFIIYQYVPMRSHQILLCDLMVSEIVYILPKSILKLAIY